MRTLNRSASRDVFESRDSPTTATPSVPQLLTLGSPVARTLADAAPKVPHGDAASHSRGKTVGRGADKTATHEKKQAAGRTTNGDVSQSKEKAADRKKTTAGDASGSKCLPPDTANGTTDAKVPKKQRIAPPLPHSSKIASLSLTPRTFCDNAAGAATIFSGITLAGRASTFTECLE